MTDEQELTRHISNEERSNATSHSKRLAIFGVVGLFVVFTASFLIRLPEGQYFTICGFKNFTGLPCPACGLTHSFCAFAKGAIGDAFAFNLLGAPLFFALFLLWIRSACVLLNKRSAVQFLDQIAGRLNVVNAFAIGFLVYGVLRIAYLLVYHPQAFRESPFLQLIGRFIP